MIKRIMVPLLIFIMISTSCSNSEQKDEKANSTLVNKSLKYQLVNITDEIINLLEKKDYIKCYDELMDFHEKANEVGIYYIADNDENAIDFKTLINELSKNISDEADKQKIQKVAIDVEKSKIKILTQMASEGGGKEESSGSQGEDGSKSSGSSEESSDDSSSSSSDSESSSGKSESQPSEDIILPQEELLKNYPELLTTDNDLAIQNKASDLYKYCSYILTLEENDKKAGLIKLKYYLYKIKNLAKLKKFNDIDKFYIKLESEWKMELENAQKVSEKDAKIVNSIIDNLMSQIKEKNIPVIDISNKIAVKSINNLIDKTS
ncbi:hypothetical protein [Vallitalea sp.]|uniref:hypothetical protein n=1 Tax=Vallitalea sp. TaxID=1882829 RepID=UPI0025FA93F3|nr:hypothetical protein [Vallitalea sp.]MCT4688371.1 hypothetical protein [Vallitalea sp.]